MITKNIGSLVVIGLLLTLGSISSSKSIAPLWNYKIENMTDFAMSRNGEYVIVACERGPLCGEGQFYVFDRYGNTVTHDCVESAITTVDIADNGAFFVGTRSGYYFSSASGRILEETNESIFESVSMSENGEIVISGTNKEILICDTNGFKDRKEVSWPVSLTAVSASGDTAVATTKDRIFLYHKSTNSWKERPTNGTILDIAISDDGSTIACGMMTRFIWILDSELNLKMTFGVSVDPHYIDITSNGKYAVCGGRQGYIFYFDLSRKEIWSYNTEKIVEKVSISTEGGLVAVLSQDILLFDASGKKIQDLRSLEPIHNIYLSRSGEILSYISTGELFFVELSQNRYAQTYEYAIPSKRSIPSEDQLIEVWSYSGDIVRVVVVADINGDGNNEIICSLSREIVVLNSEGKVLWKKQFAAQFKGLATLDLTGDFIPEVIVTSTDNRMGFQVFNGEGRELAGHEFYSRWYAESPGREEVISLIPYWSDDIDNDGFTEVICVVYAGYILEPRGFYAFEYPSFKEEWYYPVATPLGLPNFVDINGDGQVEIIAGSNAPCNGRRVGDTDDCHAYVYAVTLQGKELWTKQIGRGYKRVDVAVADLDGDGTQEIVGGGWSYENNWGALFVLDSEGNYVFGKENEFDHSVFLEGIADLDNDGCLGILTSSSPSTLVLYDHELKEIKRRKVSITLGQPTKVMINDIDSDGEKEIILISDDPKLLILNTDLEEEWSKAFPNYDMYLRATIANLNKCKNYILVAADKLYAYTYSNNPDWPCIPWVITEQQKNIEAENYIEDGNKCIEEKDCDCAKAGFNQARVIYELIQNKEGINQTKGKIQIAEACFVFEESFEEAKRLFGEADEALNVIYISKPDEYLFEAEKYLSTIEEELRKAKEAYENIWKMESEEIKEYFTGIEEIRNAVNYFDIGRKQIKEGKTNEAEENLRKAMEIFKEYEWSDHVERIDRMMLSIGTPRSSEEGVNILQTIVIILPVLAVIFIIQIYLDKRKKRKNQQIKVILKESEKELFQDAEKSISSFLKEGGERHEE